MRLRPGLLLALALVPALLLSDLIIADAQEEVRRIGFLRTVAPPEPYIDAFRQGLKERGYTVGKDIVLEYRWAGGKTGRLPELAAELVRLQVDIIVTDGTPPALAARRTSGTIPIVMAASGDPVGTGLISSLARPGGNITGLTSINAQLGGKVLELLKEIVPNLTHVAILGRASSPVDELFLKNAEPPSRALGLKLTSLLFRGPDDFQHPFRRAVDERAQALLVRGTPFTTAAHRRQIVELAAKSRLPAIYETRDWVDRGGLLSYGADRTDMYRRAAEYVDKVLRGSKPADLPVEEPNKFELVINLKTAKALGLAIPPSLLLRSDEVIE